MFLSVFPNINITKYFAQVHHTHLKIISISRLFNEVSFRNGFVKNRAQHLSLETKRFEMFFSKILQCMRNTHAKEYGRQRRHAPRFVRFEIWSKTRNYLACKYHRTTG